ncbi:hypothetical protein [Alteromonas sp. CYL-A6]|uniref:hypothetical protein n=1 Tax=Alteromonas nitratireducens TaxID=3390813 RepID=UPI0034BA0D3C
MSLSIKVNEIVHNPPFSELDIMEMAFYVKQTVHRYLDLINMGYLEMEHTFAQEENDTITIQFNQNNSEHVEYANTTLYRNLLKIYQFCFVEKDKAVFVSDKNNTDMFEGLTMGGMNDFLSETLSPCLSYHSLSENGVMDDYYEGDKIHRLFIAFFAHLKLHFGSLLDSGNCPSFEMHHQNVYRLGVHEEHFSFRELTMLSGYQTERAIRNLASPSTPEHRRISVIKEGRLTYITFEEATRWLRANSRLEF